MKQTPFQRALDGLEDRIFKLPVARRQRCIASTIAQMRQTLPSDYRRTGRLERRTLGHDGRHYHHHAIVDAVDAFPAMRDRCVVSVAQAHGQRLWWLPALLAWNSLTSGVDVFEYALTWWLTQHRWFPRVALGPVLASVALICADARRAQASASRVPAWCLAWQRAPIVGIKVCAWRIGVLSGWRWVRGGGGDADATRPDYSYLPAALRVGLAALAVLAVLHPDQAHAGVLTAAISSATAWEVQTGGSDTNGGGYSSGGTDYSQQTAAQVSVTDAVTNGTTTITSATASFTSAMVGNVCYVQGGTGSVTAGWYQVASYVSATSITVDRSTGLTAGTGVTLKLGGALASPGQASAVGVASNTYYIKAGSGYTVTSATVNIAGGCFKPIGGAGTTTASAVFGYGSTRGDLSQAVLTVAAAVASATVVSYSSNYFMCMALSVDGNNNTSSRGIATYSGYYCAASNCTNGGIYSGVHVRAQASGCSTSQAGFVINGSVCGCESFDNSVNGYTQCNATFCLSYGNTGVSTSGFTIPQNTAWVNLVAYNNGGTGFLCDGSTRGQTIVNLLAVSNGAYGLNNSLGIQQINAVVNLATYGNTSGATNQVASHLLIGHVALSGDPFTNAGSNDFSLNNTAGAGAACRSAGFPSVFPRGTTSSHVDIGASQHADPAGGLNLYAVE